jgi:hypothetical protein
VTGFLNVRIETSENRLESKLARSMKDYILIWSVFEERNYDFQILKLGTTRICMYEW